MKILSTLLMLTAAVSLLVGVILRLLERVFPIGNIPPNSIIEFTAMCLLFALALSVYQIANKS